MHGDGAAEKEDEFEVVDCGIMKKRYAANGDGELRVERAPAALPTCCVSIPAEHYLQYRVPRTVAIHCFRIVFDRIQRWCAVVCRLDDPPVEYARTTRTMALSVDSLMRDYMAWKPRDLQPQPRASAVGDKGILVFRKLLKQQIDQVRRRRDPIGVIRSAEEE